MATVFTKDPDEVLDYVRDWSAALGDDTIDTSVWDVPSGLTADSDTKTDTTTTIWLSGGELDVNYLVTNRITTTGNRTLEKTLRFRIRDK